MRYSRRSFEVEAVQYRGMYDSGIINFLGQTQHRFIPSKGIKIATVDEGVILVEQYDWIIRDDDGVISKVTNEEFVASYQEVI